MCPLFIGLYAPQRLGTWIARELRAGVYVRLRVRSVCMNTMHIYTRSIIAQSFFSGSTQGAILLAQVGTSPS